MSRRPLRQFYGADRTLDLVGLDPPLPPFRQHRERFLSALETLSDDEWSAMTRCDAWNAKDVCNHLVTADGFWLLTLQGRHAPEPTTFLRGFDPTTSPDQIIAPMKEQDSATVLDALRASTEQLCEALGAIADSELDLRSESPFGHVPVRVITAHSLWDSWLHERDVLVPLGRAVAVEGNELEVAAAFTLFIGAAQGGLLDDPEPVGDGPPDAIEAVVGFDDLPDRSFRMCVDRDAQVEVRRGAAATDGAGSAVEFVEGVAGRGSADRVLTRLPAGVAAQLDRARQIL